VSGNEAAFTPVRVHQSQYPTAVKEALFASLRGRAVNHKFHYASYKQAQQWSEIFTRYSPFINDPECRRIYEQSCEQAARLVAMNSMDVIGLGCGSGEKDLLLLRALHNSGKAVRYTPVDVSLPLVVAASRSAEDAGFQAVPGILCDLSVPGFSLNEGASDSGRLLTFFGMIPNFEPAIILPNLAGLLRPNDYLLLSANLAPGTDYEDGLRRVLPQYENPLTTAWLLTLLRDLGVHADDANVHWSIETDADCPDLRRITACFAFPRGQTVAAEGEGFSFAAGERIRLFFSYRYTLERLQTVLQKDGLSVRQTWMTDEEAVLLCVKQGQ
jgi:L-histidine Nalpha-methyltransferase